MAVFTGSAVAIVTPMKAGGEVNYENWKEIIDEQIAGGTDAIVICGTTGESSTLSHQEHLDVIGCCIRHVAGRGSGHRGNRFQLHPARRWYLSVEAEKLGADALLLVTPYYNKCTQKGLIRHYTQIAESVSIPVIMYRCAQPHRRQYPTGDRRLSGQGTVKNIVGIKEASGNISQIAKLKQLGRRRHRTVFRQ